MIWTPGEASLLKGAHDRLIKGDWPAEVRVAFHAPELSAEELAAAKGGWQRRLNGEYLAAAHFSQLTSALLVAAVPLEFTTCFSRIVLDELRHADLCGRVLTCLGGVPALEWEVPPLLDFTGADAILVLYRHVLGLACLSETVSFHVLGMNLAAAEEPAIQEVLRRIRADEAFHSQIGWPLARFLAERIGTDAARAEIPAALAAVRQEFALNVPKGARLTPGLRRLGSVSPEEYEAGLSQALEGEIAGKLVELGS